MRYAPRLGSAENLDDDCPLARAVVEVDQDELLPGAQRRPPRDADLRRLAEGVHLDDGPTAPAEVRRLGERELEIVLREGRNRQVRRMAEAIDNRVTALRRVRFGPIELTVVASADCWHLLRTLLNR